MDRKHVAVGLALRMLLVGTSVLVDELDMGMDYTDIDYHVLSDAGRHVVQGGSPYDRATYRYTPLLAWLYSANTWASEHVVFGAHVVKVLLVLADMLGAWLLVRVAHELRLGTTWTQRIACTWIYCPLVMGLSTRGSPEILILLLVTLVLLFALQKRDIATGIALGLAVHVKLFPVIHSLVLFLAFGDRGRSVFHVNMSQIRLVLSTVVSLGSLTWLFIHMYGHVFIEEAYLYHVTRRDIRHNFSVYFLPLYATSCAGDHDCPRGSASTWLLEHTTLIPPAVLIFALSLRFRDNLPRAFLLQSLSLVAYNKVMTSQYFLWFLPFALLDLPRLMEIGHLRHVLAAWIVSQICWLGAAYLLEFRGWDTFTWLHGAAVSLFCSHVAAILLIARQADARPVHKVKTT